MRGGAQNTKNSADSGSSLQAELSAIFPVNWQPNRAFSWYLYCHALAGGCQYRPLSRTFETRCWSGWPRGSFRGIYRALWQRGCEVCSTASRRGVPSHASVWARGAGARGDLFGAVGVGEGAKRSEICSPATCEVLFGARRWARARRRTIFSQARCSARVGVGEGAVACRSTARRRGDVLLGAGRRGRRRGGLKLYRLRAATDNWAAQLHLARAVKLCGLWASASGGGDALFESASMLIQGLAWGVCPPLHPGDRPSGVGGSSKPWPGSPATSACRCSTRLCVSAQVLCACADAEATRMRARPSSQPSSPATPAVI